jgi:hypothetical protein
MHPGSQVMTTCFARGLAEPNGITQIKTATTERCASYLKGKADI